jgi:superoxide reductase
MEEAHYIEWIQMITPDGKYSPRKFLKPGEAAEAKFKLTEEGAVAREYCNVHGLWKG